MAQIERRTNADRRRSDPHVLRELKEIKRKVEETLSETRKERGASVDELRAVFTPIVRKLKRIRNKLSEATGIKAPGSPE